MDHSQRLRPPYDALPLHPGRSIRLLALHPTIFGPLTGSKIKCTLQSHMMDRAPPYIALSYCWGPQDPAEEIVCNGVVMKVGPNLYSALRRLQRDQSGRGMAIWIDALCINQDSLSERSQQVSIMKEIYDRASRVPVWLGSKPDGGALKLLKKAAKYCSAELGYQNMHATSYSEISPERRQAPEKKKRNIPNIESRDWDTISKLCNRDYFRRVWVLQEASATSANIMVGNSDSMPWLDFLTAVRWVWTKNYMISTHTDHCISYISAHNLAAALRQKEEFGMAFWIRCTNQFHATDPRDLVYALYPLIEDAQSFQTFRPPPPDYSKPVEDIFMNVMKYMIEATKSLDAFFLLSLPTDSPRDMFPSWAPQLDRLASRLSSRDRIVPFSQKDLCDQWKTCQDTAVQLPLARDVSSTLVLQGVFIATITDVLALEDQLLTELLEFVQVSLGAEDASGRAAIADILARTLTAGESRTAVIEEPFRASDIEAFFTSPRTNTEDPPWGYTEPGSQPTVAGSLGRFIDCEHRVILLEGGSMGASSASNTREGDVVCVLFGGKVPYILRPEGDHFIFISECYVDHLMQGKAIDDWRAGLLKDEWIKLQ